MQVAVDPAKTRGPAPPLRGVHVGDSPEPFLEEDVARLKQEVGITCIRYGVEARTLSDENTETYHAAGFRAVGEFLDWCAKHGVHCVLDLHNALGRQYGGDARLWREKHFQDRFVSLWEQLVRRFRGHPALAAYELLNEPEPPDNDFAVWNALQQRTTAAVRALDPHCPIVVDSIGYARPQNFSGLALSGDANTVYSFHNYQPGPYHCQKRRELQDQSTYYYPGFIPHKRPEKPLDFSQAHIATHEGKFWNRRQLLEEWREVFAFRERHRAPLFCGEFGCVSDVPEMTDMVYLMDEISVFQEEGIAWTLYNCMYRTSETYWRTHFDCNLYIACTPEKLLRRFARKIALVEFFARTEGDVLAIAQPDDEWIGVYGIRCLDGSTRVLLSNKDRETARTVSLAIAGVPPQWSGTLGTMERGDEGFVYQGRRELAQGTMTLTLPALSLALLTVPASGQRLWGER